MDVTVCVATFGDESWAALAQSRALPSVPDGVPSVHVHGATLHEARNGALAQVGTEFVAFLDADDELEPGYFDFTPTADVSVPWVRYWPEGARRLNVAGHRHVCSADCLADGNYIVIGAVCRTGLLFDVGGFREWPCYEDWCLWARCWQAGASFADCPSVYRAYRSNVSRNHALPRAERLSVHQAIARANGLPVPA